MSPPPLVPFAADDTVSETSASATTAAGTESDATELLSSLDDTDAVAVLEEEDDAADEQEDGDQADAGTADWERVGPAVDTTTTSADILRALAALQVRGALRLPRAPLPCNRRSRRRSVRCRDPVDDPPAGQTSAAAPWRRQSCGAAPAPRAPAAPGKACGRGVAADTRQTSGRRVQRDRCRGTNDQHPHAFLGPTRHACLSWADPSRMRFMS